MMTRLFVLLVLLVTTAGCGMAGRDQPDRAPQPDAPVEARSEAPIAQAQRGDVSPEGGGDGAAAAHESAGGPPDQVDDGGGEQDATLADDSGATPLHLTITAERTFISVTEGNYDDQVLLMLELRFRVAAVTPGTVDLGSFTIIDPQLLTPGAALGDATCRIEYHRLSLLEGGEAMTYRLLLEGPSSCRKTFAQGINWLGDQSTLHFGSPSLSTSNDVRVETLTMQLRAR